MCVLLSHRHNTGQGRGLECASAASRAVGMWKALSLPWRLLLLIERDKQNIIICAIGTKSVG